jgi:hypothetical protein
MQPKSEKRQKNLNYLLEDLDDTYLDPFVVESGIELEARAQEIIFKNI